MAQEIKDYMFEKVIEPEIKHCPGCGVSTHHMFDLVRPQCDCVLNAFGETINFSLHWRCVRCNAVWKHGQFEVKTQ